MKEMSKTQTQPLNNDEILLFQASLGLHAKSANQEGFDNVIAPDKDFDKFHIYRPQFSRIRYSNFHLGKRTYNWVFWTFPLGI